MSTNYVELEIEAGSAKMKTATNESDRFPPALIQTDFTDEAILNPEDISQSRNSKLVGFDRGTMRLQPFVGPKQF